MPQAQPATVALILKIILNLLVKLTISAKADELCYCQSI